MGGGQLRDRVTFQRRAAGGDGRGNTRTGDWAAIDDCDSIPAQIRPVKQGEVALSEGVQGRVLFEVTVRYDSPLLGVTVGDRMVQDETAISFNVKAPPMNKDMHRKYLTFLCEHGGADG